MRVEFVAEIFSVRQESIKTTLRDARIGKPITFQTLLADIDSQSGVYAYSLLGYYSEVDWIRKFVRKCSRSDN